MKYYHRLLLIKLHTIEHFNLYFAVLPFLSPLTFCKCCTWVLLVLQFILFVVCICIHYRYQKMLHLGRIDERSICFDQDILYEKKNLVPNQARRRWWWRRRWEGWKQYRNIKVEVYNVFSSECKWKNNYWWFDV